MFEFSWDEGKHRINIRKHKVSFSMAAEVFYDPNCLIRQDRIEGNEYRWQAIGRTKDNMLILLVAHSYIDESGIRIISARKADKKERGLYERGIG